MSLPHPALLDLAAGRPLPEVGDVPELLISAHEHKMHGLLWEEVKAGRFFLPHASELMLAQSLLHARAIQNQLWDSLEDASALLRDIGIGVATAKGVAAEARWYPALGTRPSVDVDLMMRPADLGRADTAVEALEPGHRLQGKVAALALSGLLQSVDLVDRAGSHIDLHFDILKFEVDCRQRQEIWDRTQTLQTPSGAEVRVLDPETSLILFLLHLNKDRFAYLLGFVDVVRLVAQEDLDWDFIDRFLRIEGLDTHLYLAFDTVFKTLDLPAPAHPKPAGWRDKVWKALWPDSVRLGGDLGRLSHPRRQYWIAATANGRSVEAVDRWFHRIFPSQVLLDYFHPGIPGPYLSHLIKGRLRSGHDQRDRLARLESRAVDRVGSWSETDPARRGAFIVLVGPDGSGKTTVARAVLEQVGNKGRYFHFLPDPIRDLLTQVPEEAVLIEKHRDAGSRILGVLHILRNLVRAWFAYFISIRPAVRKGSIVVGDRWLYGYLTQPVAMKFYGPDWLARLAIRIMPQPNLTVALTASAELIHARKPELSLAEIEGEIETLRKELPHALVIDATEDPTSIARQLVEHVELGSGYRVYPPLLGQVLLPETSRAAALAGAALYSPARSRGLIGQRLGRGMIRLFGTSWLSRADYRDLPLDIALQTALFEFLHQHLLSPDSLAFHVRTQSGRQGFSLLAIARGRPVGFVRAGPRGTLDVECQALLLLEERSPASFRTPRLVGRTEIGTLELALMTSVLGGYHRPPAIPSLDLIIGQIKAGLADLPRPAGTPEHWEPMHGDLTPWNLREDNSGLVLIDWESVGWGPPEADRVFYAASSTAINRRIEAGSLDGEAAAFWLERMDKAVDSRDARLRRAMIGVLRSWLD